MKTFLRFNPFEIIVLTVSFIGLCFSLFILSTGTSLVIAPDHNLTIAPTAFDGTYSSPSEEAETKHPISLVSPTNSPNENGTAIIVNQAVQKELAVPALTPYPTLAPSKYDRIFLIYPASQAILTHTQVAEGKTYPLKLKFEVDPANTPCTLELKMGEELILTKELEGSPTGKYEVPLTIRKPALYKWRIKTQNTQSPERLFSVKK